ncbi:MAG: class IV adenylate cyclase [Candidatus Azambacteria bacterium]|nr:class IV adenylate cyclase [Candidatus Azambacteria bacterium]
MRKEIEVKAKVADLDTITQKILELGCTLSESLIQNDTIFVDDNYGPFDKFQPDKNLLRIRESSGKFLFTIKQPKGNQLDCIERETEILNPQEMREALLLMGYHEAVQVHKVRIKTNYNNWEICLDKVEGLGSFIEVEKICEYTDAEKVQNELFAFLQTLGIALEDRIYEGYDTLVYLSKKN